MPFRCAQYGNSTPRDSNKKQNSICGSSPLISISVPFGVTYEKIGTIQRRLAWPLHKDDTLSRSGRSTDLNIYFVYFPDIQLPQYTSVATYTKHFIVTFLFSSLHLYTAIRIAMLLRRSETILRVLYRRYACQNARYLHDNCKQY